jgi:FdrA protein
VVNFLGADPDTVRRADVHPVRTLEDAARLAVALAGGGADAETGEAPADDAPEVPQLAPGQKYIRGLYSGGTFCYEALLLLSETFGAVASNTPLDPEGMLTDVWQSERHTVIDLGDDAFTRGRPHPMIDQTLRKERILQEAADPEVAVILFDVVLGYGAHPDPAPELAAALEQARDLAGAAGRQLAFVGSVCGTAGDPQVLARQEAVLREAGVLLAESNAQAVRLAAAIAGRQA